MYIYVYALKTVCKTFTRAAIYIFDSSKLLQQQNKSLLNKVHFKMGRVDLSRFNSDLGAGS